MFLIVLVIGLVEVIKVFLLKLMVLKFIFLFGLSRIWGLFVLSLVKSFLRVLGGSFFGGSIFYFFLENVWGNL